MILQDFASIAEIVGAFAIVITLVYLAIQTRLTRQAVEESSQHAFQQATHTAVGMYSDWRRTVLGAPNIASIIVKAQNNEELDAGESLLYSICFQDLFLAAASSYRGVVHNTAGYDESIDVYHLVNVLREHPRAVRVWRDNVFVTEGISAEFVAQVNKALDEFVT